MKKGQCKLCLEIKDLCKESHIIPRFLYKFLTGENNLMVFVGSKRSEFRYNGEYEGNILCQNCDSIIIGKFDTYGADLLQGSFLKKNPPRLEYVEGKECLVLENDSNYSYIKFKLFLLSLLWRASISSRPFFKTIKLSPEKEEVLRKMILNNDPGEPSEYACFIHLPPLTVTPDGGRGFNMFHMPTMSPSHLISNGLEMCEFVIEGTHYIFLISQPPGTNVIPSVDKNKLTLGFATTEEQSKLISKTLEMMKSHPRRK